jgi:arylsulfatase A-like enzyme
LGSDRRRAGFSEMHGMGYEPFERAPAYMWRTKEWKLILYLPCELRQAASCLDTIKGELYHLPSDPKEYVNLYEAPEHLPVRESLMREMLMYLACMWSKYPRQASVAKLK